MNEEMMEAQKAGLVNIIYVEGNLLSDMTETVSSNKGIPMIKGRIGVPQTGNNAPVMNFGLTIWSRALSDEQKKDFLCWHKGDWVKVLGKLGMYESYGKAYYSIEVFTME